MQSNSFNPISAGAQMSIKAFYYDFCEFMVENYSATPDQLTLDWNCVGATARYHGQNRAFEFRLWERSNGHLEIPDMTVIVSVLYISGLVANAQAKADAVSLWLRDAAKANGFLHIADESHAPMDAPNQAPGCKIACLTL
jgi:hypothetical protein